MKLSQVISKMAELFSKAGIESNQADAEILLSHILRMSRGELQAKAVAGEELPEELSALVEELSSRRAGREPLQHLTGWAAFRSLELSVGPGVFVPRFETEVLVSHAIEAIKQVDAQSPKVVDLATGSGAIALSIAVEVPNAEVHAVELSEEALHYTRQNFEKYSAHSDLRQGDLKDAFEDLEGLVDVVVSNPPYIPDEMVPIYPEVNLFDPKLALYGGADGLNIVKDVEKTATRLLKPGGRLFIEHADSQGEAVRAILLATGWQEVVTHQDLAGRDRLVSAVR